VADSGNNRVLVFPDPHSTNTPTTGTTAFYSITGLNGPQGVYVSPSTGNIWVANTKSSTIVEYPSIENLVVLTTSPTAMTTIPAAWLTLAVTQDQFGALYAADASNRVAIYFPAPKAIVNGANFLTTHPLAPGTWASIFPQGNQLSADTASFSSYPLPTTLADTEVTLNGNPVPLSFVSPGQINFFTPNSAPTSGTAEVNVVQASTGQVIASGLVPMNSVSPGIFAIDSSGTLRRAAVINQDNTLNDPSNPAKRGSIISIYATGYGALPDAPPDGTPAPDASSGLITIPTDSQAVVINGYYPDQFTLQPGDPSDGQFIKYSGLAPGFVGLWQINFQIPMGVPPGSQIPLAIVLNGYASWDNPSVNSQSFITTIAVK